MWASPPVTWPKKFPQRLFFNHKQKQTKKKDEETTSLPWAGSPAIGL